jgi:hypothetical protein
VLAACTVLAREILEAGDRVVANHARCRRIVTRIRLMQPLLQKLQKTTQGYGALATHAVSFGRYAGMSVQPSLVVMQMYTLLSAALWKAASRPDVTRPAVFSCSILVIRPLLRLASEG